MDKIWGVLSFDFLIDSRQGIFRRVKTSQAEYGHNFFASVPQRLGMSQGILNHRKKFYHISEELGESATSFFVHSAFHAASFWPNPVAQFSFFPVEYSTLWWILFHMLHRIHLDRNAMN
jgi:hypothetical protein